MDEQREPPVVTASELAATRPNGPDAAVVLATGIGAFALGLFTTLAEASEGIHDWLEFDEEVGPLSGKTIVAAVVFLASWGLLHMALRGRELAWRTVIMAMVVLVALGVLGTFPTFFQEFASE